MTRLLVLLTAALTLSACSPASTTLERNQDTVRVTFDPGPSAAIGVAILITGDALETADAATRDACIKRASGNIGCVIPTVPQGQPWIGLVKGRDVRCNVTFYRPGSILVQAGICAVRRP